MHTHPEAHVVHRLMLALVAVPLVRELPVQALAVAFLAEVVAGVVSRATELHQRSRSSPERIGAKEADERVQLADPVLQRGPREAPSVFRLKSKCGLGGVGRAFLDVVGLVEDHPAKQSATYSQIYSKSEVAR